jgi:cytidine deaminase
MKMEIALYQIASADTIITCRVFYKGNGNLKKARILSFGFNQMGDSYGKQPGIHAEYNALSKLIPLKNKKKLESINLIVIRLSTKNKIQSSKPCNNCIESMKTIPQRLGYKINHIYYSDENGCIIKTNLKTLDTQEKHYSKYFRRKIHKQIE